MTTNKPETMEWGNDPRKMTETDLLPCPNCKHRAGRATERATKGFPFIGLWKVSCQRPDCPLAMIYFHPVEWNCLPRVSQAAHEALQAECETLRKVNYELSGLAYNLTADLYHLRKDAERYRWLKPHLYVVDTYSGKGISYEVGIDGAEVPDIDDVTEAIDAAMQGATHDNQ